jgi:hypothetical protein
LRENERRLPDRLQRTADRRIKRVNAAQDSHLIGSKRPFA